jgi:hypothetical protein
MELSEPIVNLAQPAPLAPPFTSVHPLAERVPAMLETERVALLEDIKLNGQRVPAIVLDGVLIDGRSRAAACAELGLPLLTEPYEGDTSEAGIARFVISMNIKRRHLTKAQLTDLAVAFEPAFAADAKLRVGGRPPAGEKPEIARSQVSKRAPQASALAAAEVGASEASVRRLKAIKQRGIPELVEAVLSSSPTIGMEAGAKIAKLPAEEQLKEVTMARNPPEDGTAPATPRRGGFTRTHTTGQTKGKTFVMPDDTKKTGPSLLEAFGKIVAFSPTAAKKYVAEHPDELSKLKTCAAAIRTVVDIVSPPKEDPRSQYVQMLNGQSRAERVAELSDLLGRVGISYTEIKEHGAIKIATIKGVS